ncbi:MAG TPA: SCO2525 family SAM-dependent methyltransferase [Pseudonocardiaceae bacterium]|jgi:hypothetical protein|nr:SCO2525 family SAM-dependent methyltransferase [Pseudonocardiaceae bacterium]
MTSGVAPADVDPGLDEVDEQRFNGDFPWDEFDTTAYLDHNYTHVREDDREILEIIAAHFARECGGERAGTLRGIDLGTGANLYPTLAMLPFCELVTLYEFSASNVSWLREERRGNWPSWRTAWQGFWQVLSRMPAYDRATEPDMGAKLARHTTVEQGSVFDLQPTDDQHFDLGTMFFVAESITKEREEFRSAMRHFLGALRPGAPFAIALMEHSIGYQVGDNHFPATDIDDSAVGQFLREQKSTGVKIKRVGTGSDPVREGYTGMIIVCGRTRGAHDWG